jgi:hypothetical protein
MKLINTITTAAAFSVATFAFTQSNGCGGTPTALPANTSCITQTFSNNQNGTGQTVNASCAGGYGNALQDVWYSVTGTGNPMTITMSGSNQDGVLAAFTGCGTGELACSTIDSGNSGSIVFPTTLGTTYFIQIQRRSGGNNANMSGDICAVSASGGAGPANNDPCSATPLAVNAACVNVSGTNIGATDSGIPDPGCAFYSGGDVWYSVVVPASGNINVLTSDNGGITDGGMAIYSGACGAPTLLQCDDDGNGLLESIQLIGQTPGATLLVRVWEFGGGASGTFDICATDPIVPTNISCDVPDPICSGSPIIFTAQSNGTQADVVNPGNNYDCLFSSPNPSWYYLEIDTPGNLDIDITAGSDIDFAIWGPYANLAAAIANCDSHGLPVDCSFSTAAVEQANVPGVLAGEVYVLLVTNFANTVQTITVDEAATNSASTDCSIVPLPVELVQFEGIVFGKEVQLTWSTVSERDNDFFIAERSQDGVNWTSFAMINGAGNSNEVLDYEVIDSNPKGGVSYYRLKQFDFNGSMTTSDFVSITRNDETEVQLFPNPARNHVKITASDIIYQVDLVAISGAIAKSVSFTDKAEITMDLSDIKDGVYLATIYTENETLVKRLVVSN